MPRKTEKFTQWHKIPSADIHRKKTKKKVVNAKRDAFTFSREDKVLLDRLKVIRRQIPLLRQEAIDIRETLKKRRSMARAGNLRPVKLYALRLEHGCWYIGMSYDVERRFAKHKSGGGATWTKHHKPKEIFEVRDTGVYIQDKAAPLEDDMTLEYALKYGSHCVRGGGWSQMKPTWPSLILDNELPY